MMQPVWADALLIQSTQSRNPQLWHIRSGWNAHLGARTQCEKTMKSVDEEWVTADEVANGLDSRTQVCNTCWRRWEMARR